MSLCQRSPVAHQRASHGGREQEIVTLPWFFLGVDFSWLGCDIGGAIWSQGWGLFPYENWGAKEPPESSKSQGSWQVENFVFRWSIPFKNTGCANHCDEQSWGTWMTEQTSNFWGGFQHQPVAFVTCDMLFLAMVILQFFWLHSLAHLWLALFP